LNTSSNSPRVQRWLRFLIGGGINTIFTYGLYLLLNRLMGYQAAYFIAYFVGVIFSYWFNSTIVFRISLSWKGFFFYPIVYVVQYVASALLLGGLVEIADISMVLAPLVVTVVMVPLTYVMSQIVLSRASRTND
jgi:putative flippase GtrA